MLAVCFLKKLLLGLHFYAAKQIIFDNTKNEGTFKQQAALRINQEYSILLPVIMNYFYFLKEQLRIFLGVAFAMISSHKLAVFLGKTEPFPFSKEYMIGFFITYTFLGAYMKYMGHNPQDIFRKWFFKNDN